MAQYVITRTLSMRDYEKKEYLRVHEGLFKWDADIGMAEHWLNAKTVSSIIDTLGVLDGSVYIYSHEKFASPKFKRGQFVKFIENGIHVHVNGYKIKDGRVFYDVTPVYIEECYLTDIDGVDNDHR